MTRFARAKGSKACNERREEEATPWHVMRQQLADQLSSSKVQNSDDTSYNLKDILNKKNGSTKEEIWSDFGESKINNSNKLSSKKGKVNTGNKKSQSDSTKTKSNLPEYNKTSGKLKQHSANTADVKYNDFKEDGSIISNKSLKKRKVELLDVEFKVTNKKHKADNKNKFFTDLFGESKKKKNGKMQGKNVFIESPVESKENDDKLNNFCEYSKVSLEKVDTGNLKTVKKKTKKKKIVEKPHVPNSSLNNDNTPRPSTKQTTNETPNEKHISKTVNSSKHLPNKAKDYNNSDYYGAYANQYRKPNFQTIIANGREINIIKYQGFFVKKDDAEELKKLRKKLLAEKIPKEKLENIMKLERRKAEKALAREKKKVCFHCRQFGHNFSDCPDIKESDMIKTGVCFKCGSLEHSHFECKVLQQQEFRHAICFVCKEQGHIARQCPLNSQGLYPKGGSCHLCGEVTHLRKDCPKAVEEKTTKSVTVDTLTSGTLEDIQNQPLQQKESGMKKKVIKFK